MRCTPGDDVVGGGDGGGGLKFDRYDGVGVLT